MEPVLWRQGDGAGIYRGKHEKERERGYARDGAVRIFTHGHGKFAKCAKMGLRYGELLETSFSLFSQIPRIGKRYRALLEMLLQICKSILNVISKCMYNLILKMGRGAIYK